MAAGEISLFLTPGLISLCTRSRASPPRCHSSCWYNIFSLCCAADRVLLTRLAAGSAILRLCAAAEVLVLFRISSTAFSLRRACTRPFRVFTHSSAPATVAFPPWTSATASHGPEGASAHRRPNTVLAFFACFRSPEIFVLVSPRTLRSSWRVCSVWRSGPYARLTLDIALALTHHLRNK